MAHSEDFHRTSDRVQQYVWIPDEYEAGYQARLQGVVEFKTATSCWRAGWQEADRELAAGGESAADRLDETSIPEQWSLYGTGQMARLCELPFDEARAEPWKRSWIETDIELGMAARSRHG